MDIRRLATLLTGCLILLGVDAAHAQPMKAKRPPAGPVVTIHAPHPQSLELALDEIELDWSAAPGAKAQAPAQSAIAVAGTTILERSAARAVVAVAGATTPQDLLTSALALQAANPGAEGYLVLYEPGLPKTLATRQLLTREVALVLEPGQDPVGALAGLPSGAVRPIRGVPDAYAVLAPDPLAALDLADALRQRPGVRSAYPLLKRQQFPR